MAESSSFNIEAFMDLLRERIYTSNPFVRQFLVSWVSIFSYIRFHVFSQVFRSNAGTSVHSRFPEGGTNSYPVCSY